MEENIDESFVLRDPPGVAFPDPDMREDMHLLPDADFTIPSRVSIFNFSLTFNIQKARLSLKSLKNQLLYFQFQIF